MGITLYWNEDQTIIHQVYANIWTEQDFIRAVDTTRLWLSEVDYPVDIILDLSYSRITSLHIYNNVSFNTLRYLDQDVHPNRRLIFVMGGDEFSGLIMTSLQRIAPYTARWTYFVENAYQMEFITHQYNQVAPPAYR